MAIIKAKLLQVGIFFPALTFLPEHVTGVQENMMTREILEKIRLRTKKGLQ